MLANVLKLWPKNQLSVKITPHSLLSQVLSSLMSNVVCFTDDTKDLSYTKGIGSLHDIM